MKKPILLVPMSNRTNYSKIRPILLELKQKDLIDIQLVLSSSILLDQYGNAFKDISNDGFNIKYKIDCLLNNDTLESMSKTIGLSLIEHSTVNALIQPNAVLVTGDRFDILGSVLSSSVMNIPIFHIQGGEITGSIDDLVRNMITLCSTKHYVSTEKSKERVFNLINSDKEIYNFGCPAVEMVSNIVIKPKSECENLFKKINLSIDDKFFLIAMHPNTTKKDLNIDDFMQALDYFNYKTVFFHPNPDAFNKEILNAFKKYNIVTHVPIEDFVQLMNYCSCMIGNSSAGIREAASFGTPVVNIGSRQQNRERNKNTLDTVCETECIIQCISESLRICKYPINNIYYKKNSAKNISENIMEYLL